MKFKSSATIVFGAVVLATAACGDGKDGENSMADSAALAAGASTAATPAAPAGLSDANIVYILDQANMSDSAHGALAERMATSTDVRDFGRLMMGEHHALRQQGQTLASKLGVTPAAPAGDQSEATAMQSMSMLEGMAKGAAWDKAYIDHEVTYHTQVLQTAQTALGAAQNQELKDLIAAAAPVIQKHLDRAKELQSKMSSGQ